MSYAKNKSCISKSKNVLTIKLKEENNINNKNHKFKARNNDYISRILNKAIIHENLRV